MWVDSTKTQPKISSLKGMGLSKPLDPNDCLTILPLTKDMIALQSWEQWLPNNLARPQQKWTQSNPRPIQYQNQYQLIQGRS
jgi:hypothetical protein